MTPEGKVKAAIKRYLKRWDIFTDWPVPSGFGKSTLDCMIICNGVVAWIEAKAPNKEPTPRQEGIIRELRRHGAEVFVIDTADTSTLEYERLRLWLTAMAARLKQ